MMMMMNKFIAIHLLDEDAQMTDLFSHLFFQMFLDAKTIF